MEKEAAVKADLRLRSDKLPVYLQDLVYTITKY